VPDQNQTFEVTSPDGRQVEITGSKPPGEDDLKKIFAAMPAKPTPQKSGGQFLGDTTKASNLKPPETTGSYLKRQGTSLIRTMYESVPLLTGATGAAALSETGPVGMVAGAGAGGMVGKRLQQYIRAVTRVGSLPKQSLPTSGAAIGQMGSEATSQMAQQAVGEIISVPLGSMMRGGFVRNAAKRGEFGYETQGVADAAAKDKEYGTNLSGPELLKGTRAGRIGARVQSYSSGSNVGGIIQGERRSAADLRVTKRLDSEVRLIATPVSKREAGRVAEAGIGAAKAGLSVTGKEMEQIAKNAPPLDLTAAIEHNGVAVSPSLKSEANRIFETEVLPYLIDFPDKAGRAKPFVLKLKDSPELIQRASKQVRVAVADAVLEKSDSPIVRTLRTLLDAGDSVKFESAQRMREDLRTAGGPGDTLFRNRAKAMSKHFEGLLSEHLEKASPEFAAKSHEYHAGADVVYSDAIQHLFSTAKNNPEQVLDYLKDDAPTKWRMLRKGLLEQAGKGDPDVVRQGKQAFDLVRASWWQEQIIHGGGKEADLDGMAERIKAIEKSGVAKEALGDKAGQRLLQHGKDIAELIAKRTPEQTGNIRMIMEMSRMLSAGMLAGSAILKGGMPSPGSFVAAGAWEGIPAFLTWVMHDPKATTWFIQGVKATNPDTATSAIMRLGELYRRTHAKEKPEAKP
jgi:hypothetical protein